MAKEKIHKPAVKVAEDKQAAAAAAVAALEKRFGEGTINRVGAKVRRRLGTVPTGIYTVDNFVIGCGGFPRGRISEVFGPESSGKTTLTLHGIAEAQRAGGQAFFVDAEHAIDLDYAAALGVDVDNLYLAQPDNGEQGLEITEMLVRSGAFDFGVVDSVAALVPQAEIDGEMGDAMVGLHARLMSQAMKKLCGVVNKSETALVFINQLREKIGVMYGNPEVTTGGRALRFYASVRLEVRRTASNKIGDEIVSNSTNVKAVKNKVGVPHRVTNVPIEFGKGFNRVGSVIEAGITNGAIDKAGAWLSFNGERLGQGKDAAMALLEANNAMYESVYEAVLRKDREVVAA